MFCDCFAFFCLHWLECVLMCFLGQAGPHHPQPEALPVTWPLTESFPSAEMIRPRTGHVTQAGPIRSFPGRAQGKLGEQVSPCQSPHAGRRASGALCPCPPCGAGGPDQQRHMGRGSWRHRSPSQSLNPSPRSPFFTPEARQHPSRREEPSSDWLRLLTLLCVGFLSLTARVVTTVSLHSIAVTPVFRGGSWRSPGSRSYPLVLWTSHSFQLLLFISQ